jgi:hypothetical protein
MANGTGDHVANLPVRADDAGYAGLGLRSVRIPNFYYRIFAPL